MQFTSKLAPIFLFLAAFAGCSTHPDSPEQEEEIYIETIGLNFISPFAAEFRGEIRDGEEQQINDYGFVYGYTDDININSGNKISLGGGYVSGPFSKIVYDIQSPVVNGIQKDLILKAYITDRKGTRYGKSISSHYNGILSNEIQPLNGKVGDLIVIKANIKGLKESEIKVIFGNIEAKIMQITDSEIRVTVPKGIAAGHGDAIAIKLHTGAIETTPTVNFHLWANITDIQPRSGPIGTKLTFSGDNLPLNKEAMRIDVDETPAINYFEGSYYARIPSALKNEKVKFYQYTSTKIPLPWEFIITPPMITSISPNPVLPFEKFKVHLENFEPYDVGLAIRTGIPGVLLLQMPDQNGDIQWSIDVARSSGKSFQISVLYGPHTVKAPELLHVIKPEVTDFSPKTGFSGTVLRFTGKFAKAVTYRFIFNNGAWVMGHGTSSTTAQVVVPSGILTDTYSIKMHEDNGDIEVPGTFEGQRTRFDSISATSGPAGTIVTLTGEGFYSNSNKITIALETEPAEVSENALNKLVFQVPNSIKPGIYSVKVVIDGIELDTFLRFTVTQ